MLTVEEISVRYGHIQAVREASLTVALGSLEIAELALGSIGAESAVSAALDGAPVPCTAAVDAGRLVVAFDAPVTVGAGHSLRVVVS